MPDQHGRTVVVTGASSGIGLETARVLAEHGARVVLACRDPAKAKTAADRIRRSCPAADVPVMQLDLASLASIRAAAADLRSGCDRIDVLVNNAGVMMPPYGHTHDGFELQLGINHLGHFALAGELLEQLLEVPGSRVVTVSSNNHRAGRINFDDLQSTRRYRRTAAYNQAKLANLMFTYELQRRLDAAGAPTIAVAAHPGLCRTDLPRHLTLPMRVPFVLFERPFAQSSAMGALPTLRAATDPAVRGGEYYGPSGRAELRGFPRRVESSAASHDRAAGQRLWRESERITDVRYPV